MATGVAAAVAGLVVALAAGPAVAVVGSARVALTGAEGEPVAGATIRLVPRDASLPEQEARTDADGVAVVPLEAGRYELQIRSRDHVSETRPIEVAGGETTDTRVQVEPVRPWMVQNPGGSCCGFGVGPLYWGEWSHLDLGSEDEVQVLNGGSPVDLGATSVGRDFSLDMNAGGVEAVFGLPKLPLFRGVRLYPALNVGLGGVAARVESADPSNPASAFRLKGSGPLVLAGADLVLASPECPFYGELAYGFQWSRFDLDRKPCAPATTSFPVTCEDDAETEYRRHWVAAQLGVANSDFGIHAGVGYSDMRLENDVMLHRVASTPTSTQTLDNFVHQELDRDRVQGIAGLDARLGPIFGRVETRFDDEDVSVMLKLIWGFGFVDWFPW